MIVLHGWWATPSTPEGGGALVLWAEDALGPTEGERRPGRRPKVRDHPFALDAERLAKALGLPDPLAGQPEGELDAAPRAGAAALALPAVTSAPTASPELLDLRSGEGVAQGETVRLRPDVRWRVPTLAIAPANALPVLRALVAAEPGQPGPQPEPDAASEHLRVGSDLRQLLQLAGFAVDLTGRGRVLPVALPAEPGTGVARWRPLLTGADAEWFRAAVAALPGAYRAGAGDAAASAAAALDALTDAVVRARIDPPPRPRGQQSGLGAWRRALRGGEPRFAATDQQLATLTGALAHWQAEAVTGGAVRACFRLVEPADDDEASILRRPTAPARSGRESAHWRIEFGLQDTDEPSLVTMAEQIWAPKAKLPALARLVERPTEALLAELGRALRLYPELGDALAGPRPSELLLDTAEAHAFLADTAPLLIGAGFGVLLPGWWSRPRSRLGARLRAGTPAQPGRVEGAPALGQNRIVEFDWRLSVGDEVLTDAEVDELIETRAPLVRLRGEWMQVDSDRLRKARDFLRRQGREHGVEMTVADVLRALGAGDDGGPGGLPVTGVEAAGWLADLLAPDAEGRLRAVPTPAGFTGTLRPYQERGLSWLAFLESIGLGGLLADDMGLGKTVQLLALIAADEPMEDDGSRLERARHRGGGPDDLPPGPTLLICPMSLVGNWQREAARFTPGLRVHVHHGKERPQGKDFRAAVAGSDLVITTYALLARDAAALRAIGWRRVILDEAQAVKNAATQAAIAARALRAPRRIAVTGTPVENRLADLWSLMEFANPKLLGDATEFKRRFALPIERLADAGASARLRALTQPFVLRRLKTDSTIISDLPEKLEMEVVCTLTAEQAALYQSVVDDMLERIEQKDGMERRGLVLAAMTKLKQVCNHPAQFLRDGSRVGGRSGKLARLEETLEEVLAAGEKALLFTQFAEFGEMLRAHLTARFGREVAFLHGGIARAQRDELVARFQADGRGPSLFVLSLKAGGTGLTLTAANHVFHVDRWWNPAVEDQATDRAFRIGQSRAVQVRKFVTAGTLEEKIAAMIRDKRGLAASVVGTSEAWLTELSTTQLRELFTLESGSVVQ